MQSILRFIAVFSVVIINPVYVLAAGFNVFFIEADCDPTEPVGDLLSGDNPNELVVGQSASCASISATASAHATAKIHSNFVSVKSSAEAGLYESTSISFDSVVAQPEETTLLGQPGKFEFSYKFDGTLQGAMTSFAFVSYGFADNNELFFLDHDGTVEFLIDGGSTPLDVDLTNDVVEFENQSGERGKLTGTVTVSRDVVFGEPVQFGFGTRIVARNPGSVVDFSSTTTFFSALLRDQAGNFVESSLVTAAGLDLQTFQIASPVPLPSGLILFSSVFGFAGMTHLRRSTAIKRSN
ncbi:MAG: hypothetical protein AAF607_15780 [Pseudomonadota bacterium]